MDKVKVVRTSIIQTIEIELPEGYVLNESMDAIHNTFLSTLTISLVKVEPNVGKDNG